jgi:hypothetical protein
VRVVICDQFGAVIQDSYPPVVGNVMRTSMVAWECPGTLDK